MIRLENVSFSYGDVIALSDINLNIAKGECVAITGPNGCGKSTLLKIINGLLLPKKGSYHFEDNMVNEDSLKDQSFAKALHQKIGFIFQNSDVQLFCNSVYEEIAFGPSQMGLADNETADRVEAMIKLFDIDKLRDRASYYLSGGEKKKVALASIMAVNPSVLVLDEPLASLDKRTGDWLISFLQELKGTGKTIIIATHDERIVDALADRVITMDDDHKVVNG